MKIMNRLCLFLVCVFLLVPQLAMAADSTITQSLQPLLDQAKKSGATVIVVEPSRTNALNTVEENSTDITKFTQRVWFRGKVMLQGAYKALSQFPQLLDKLGGEQGLGWIVYGISYGLIASFVGFLLNIPIRRWAVKKFTAMTAKSPENRGDAISVLLLRALVTLLALMIYVGSSILVVMILAQGEKLVLLTAMTVVQIYCLGLLWRLIFMGFLCPRSREYRPINMSDADAYGLYRDMFCNAVIAFLLFGFAIWVRDLEIDSNLQKLAFLVNAAFATLSLSALAIIYRKAVAGAILGAGDPLSKPAWRRFLAGSWHIFVVLYFVIACVATSIRQVLDLPAATGLITAPLGILIAMLMLYGLLLLIIDRVLDGLHKKASVKLAEEENILPGLATSDFTNKDMAIGDGVPSDVDDADNSEAAKAAEKATQEFLAEVQSETAADDDKENIIFHHDELPTFWSRLKPIAENAAGILVNLIGLSLLLQNWGLQIYNNKSRAVEILDIMLVLFIAYIGYQVVRIWIDSKIEQEGGFDEGLPGEGEGGGAGASRLATLLPIFRNFLLITIVVIAAMMGLSEIGLDIGPLFAGAGVIGLAIGFGAQTLIRDIFSGAFFLVDDAFRLGEYVDIGEAKGTVERISIRSFQLRHHNGPLNTIPFGEIKQINNFSRDWVMMKLPMRVTYDTDVELVRRLVKKLGQKLMEHPELGPMFLQPLKSQGVIQMDDSAMIIRVKFMTRPGDQFILRREVFRHVQELFEANGIKFAHREVTVRIADGDSPTLTPIQREAVAGSVLSALDRDDDEEEGSADSR